MKPIRKALIAILVLLITLPCIAIASARYTGYINKNTYVYKKPSIASQRLAIARNTKVYVIGQSGKFYKVQNTKRTGTGYVLKTDISKTKVPETTPSEEETGEETGTGEDVPTDTGSTAWKSKVVKLDWYKTGKDVLKRGAYGYLYDIDTGIRMRIKRMGGTNHADVEPATAADTAKLKKIAGGKFSWTCHAVILQANGQYVACSINTLPHGDQTILNNGYNGQFCMHMVNSRTHGSNKINPNHQACINRAYKWAHG
jgi:hypothetical protein